MVNSTGSSTNVTNLMSQAVSAIGSYRTDLQSQLPAPVSSLTQLKGINNLDTALTGQARQILQDSTASECSRCIVLLKKGCMALPKQPNSKHACLCVRSAAGNTSCQLCRMCGVHAGFVDLAPQFSHSSLLRRLPHTSCSSLDRIIMPQ